MRTIQMQGLTITPENQEIVYNASDTLQTMALKEIYDEGLLPAWAKTTYEYSELMLGPIMTMMRRGVQIDTARRDMLVAGLRARADKVQANFDYVCEALWGTTINHNSTPQRNYMFYTLLAIPEQTKSKKGETKVGTDREILERIASNYPRGAFFANHILRIRDLEKQIEFLSKKLSPSNRFHASFNIAGTETFRLSSSEHPFRIGSNLQNIPKDARSCFVADPGYMLFYSDQQGAEARIVAYLSGDENYIAAVEGGDSHTMVASMVFGFPPERDLAEREYYRGYSYRDITKKGAHGCLTADHEVLTPGGWVSIAEKPSVIAVWGQNEHVRWERPSQWTDFVTDKLVSIEGPSLSSLSTPDHRFIVKVRNEWAERTAATLKKRDRIPYAGYWDGGKVTEPCARLVAAYQADGSESGGAIRFKFRKQRKIERMRWLLAGYPGEWTEAVHGKDTVFRLNCSLSAMILPWGKHASAKLLEWQFVSLRDFVDESIHWDGTRGATGREAICSVNLEHCRWMQTFYQLTGYGSKLIDNTGKLRTNAFGKQRPHWASRNNRKYAGVSACKIEEVAGPQRVFCPTVSTGYFLVRRKNHIYVTGNSNYYGKPFTLAQQMKVEKEVAEAFQTQYFRRFPGISDWHVWVAKQLQTKGYLITPFGIRRNFWNRRWDDATLREAIAFVPQHCVGVLMNVGIYRIWERFEGRPGADVQILLNLHDAVLGQVRIDKANELLPQVLECLHFPFPVTDINGKSREIVIPFDVELGYNWLKASDKNPDGLKKWRPDDKA